MEANVPLKDENAEKLVLGTLMSVRDGIDQIQDLLCEGCFFNPFHAEIYRAIVRIVSSGEDPDLVTVAGRLSVDKMYDLSEISSCRTFDLIQHARRLKDLYIRRQFNAIGQYLVSNSFSESEDIVDVTNKATDDLSALFKSSITSISTINDAIKGVCDMINSNLAGGKPITGTPTGFEKIDAKSGGLQKSDLIIIAGETSQGKTSFVVSLMRNAALSGRVMAMYSMEMKKEQIAARILSMESGVPANEIMYTSLTESKLQAVQEGIGKIDGMGIYFDDSSTSNIDTIISSIRFMKRKYDIDGAIVDYLQILNVNMKGANKEQQMGDVARRLKNLAKELDIWVIALSQLNRDRDNPVPTLARLRDSGQIAEAADTVILIYRPEVYGKSYPGEFSKVNTKGTAMIDIAKGRNIGLLRFICGFNACTTRFHDIESVPLSENTDMEDDSPF